MGLSFLGLFSSLGIRISFGAYVTSWENEFALSRTFVSLVSMISLVTYGVSQPFTGKMNDRFGARAVLTVSLLLIGLALVLSSFATNIWQLAFLYGVIGSVGFSGASNVTATAVAARWFVKKRGLAMGIVLSGMATGQLLLVPLSLYMITMYSWRTAMLVFGLVIGLGFTLLCYLFIRSKPSDVGLSPYGEIELPEKRPDRAETAKSKHPAEKTESIFTILKIRMFWILTVPYFICGFTDMGLIATHLIPFAEGKGFSVAFVSLLFSIIAVFNIAGTIGSGHLSDRFDRGKLLAIIYAVRGLTFLLLLNSGSNVSLVMFAVLYGISEMASIAPTSSLCAHLFGRHSIGAIFGFISVSHQIGAAVGSFIPSLFYDFTGSYTPIIVISVALLLLSSLIMLKVPDTEAKEGAALPVRNA